MNVVVFSASFSSMLKLLRQLWVFITRENALLTSLIHVTRKNGSHYKASELIPLIFLNVPMLGFKNKIERSKWTMPSFKAISRRFTPEIVLPAPGHSQNFEAVMKMSWREN